jgi:hypothetical protein
MACNETLELGHISVSRQLLRSAERIQGMFRDWSDGLARVTVEAEPEAHPSKGSGKALFFSGGVDSWYSLLTSMDGGSPPSHLMFLVGFDMDESQRRRVRLAREVAEETASEFGLKLVVSRSNLRRLTDPLVQWSLYHGGYLAGVALALGEDLSRCLISASNSPDSIRPWGSHPDLDRLWSTESLEIAQMGFEETRFEKIKRVSESELALRTLRVCWQPVDEYNCGKCPKCSLTMAALHLLGKLDKAATFPDRIDMDALGAVDAGRRGERRTAINAMIPVAVEQGELPIARALRKARRSRYLRPGNYVGAAARMLRGEHGPKATIRR